jgi:hypothetical protein
MSNVSTVHVVRWKKKIKKTKYYSRSSISGNERRTLCNRDSKVVVVNFTAVLRRASASLLLQPPLLPVMSANETAFPSRLAALLLASVLVLRFSVVRSMELATLVKPVSRSEDDEASPPTDIFPRPAIPACA